MKRTDFAYDLPEELIAAEPLVERSASRLMIVPAANRGTRHGFVATDLLALLRPGDLIVVNNTRVIPARLTGTKSTGGQVEVMIERIIAPHQVRAFVRASKTPKVNSLIELEVGYQLRVLGRDGDLFLLEEIEGRSLLTYAETHGHVPLPPYMKRQDRESDRERYQTVFAKHAGAVAAPTAGLHFDQALIEQIKAKGVEWVELTLHVGAGTFNPVRVEDIADHQMHAEWYEITTEAAQRIQRAKAEGRRVIAIGTTSLRALEGSAAQSPDGQVRAETAETNVFVTPGFAFRVVDCLFTNFHLPESTLMMLISAFAGYDRVMAAYREAVMQRYRFFSYGDACWFERAEHDA